MRSDDVRRVVPMSGFNSRASLRQDLALPDLRECVFPRSRFRTCEHEVRLGCPRRRPDHENIERNEQIVRYRSTVASEDVFDLRRDLSERSSGWSYRFPTRFVAFQAESLSDRLFGVGPLRLRSPRWELKFGKLPVHSYITRVNNSRALGMFCGMGGRQVESWAGQSIDAFLDAPTKGSGSAGHVKSRTTCRSGCLHPIATRHSHWIIWYIRIFHEAHPTTRDFVRGAMESLSSIPEAAFRSRPQISG